LSTDAARPHRDSRRAGHLPDREENDMNAAEKMETRSFSTSFTVDQSPREVFDAINDVRAWWSLEITGRTDAIGSEFTYRYKDIHRSTQKVTELVPGKRVVWHVSDAHLSIVRNGTEWNGTDIVFEIARKDGKTEVRFTHVGLVPSFQCYADCSGAWEFYVQDSLRSRIATGKGAPNPREA
jgi:uncharacterized protein YndB with AHSA1/START domain